MIASNMVGSEVRIIQAKPRQMEKRKALKKKVAAYCRVSKDIEEQATSLETQKAAFEETIKVHPDWKLAGIYADKGITGTSSESRVEFLRMIDDAKAGLIDIILVKSISRFARNTVDTLKFTRDLKETGVYVFFEKEKINTAAATSEMLLTVYASFAQEESRSISENQKRGFINRFELGIPKWSNVLGYRQTETRAWVIEPVEAAIVRWIFEAYEHGLSLNQICEVLKEDDNLDRNWKNCSVKYILTNVSYCGDLEMQKWVTKDFITHKMTRNDGERYQKKFYSCDHHPAIVDRETFHLCQKIRSLKDSHNGMSQYPFGEYLKCPYCGEPMIGVNYSSRQGRRVWTCGGHGEAGLLKDRRTCPEYWVQDVDITRAQLEAIEKLPETEEYAEMQAKVKETKQIEYYILARYINRITFPDWNTMIVEWKSGKVTLSKMKYTRTADYPIHKVTKHQGKYMMNGKILDNAESYQICFDHIRRVMDEVFITPPTRDGKQLSYSVKLLKKEKSNDCTNSRD